MNELYKAQNINTESRIGAIFTCIFILQNRLQTAGEKIQTEITMKQWLLLAMAHTCPEPRTLTKVGELMGCSRQNVKKLALVLQNKGYLQLCEGHNNSLNIHFTDKMHEYMKGMTERHVNTLKLLFADFTEEEIQQMFSLMGKLCDGVERVEEYAEQLKGKA